MRNFLIAILTMALSVPTMAREVTAFGYTLGEPMPEETTLHEASGFLFAGKEVGEWRAFASGLESTGICRINLSREVDTGGHGVEAMNVAKSVESDLVEKYGEPTVNRNLLREGSVWKEPQYWVMALVQKDRVYVKAWKLDYVSIALGLTADALANVTLSVIYEVPNAEEVCDKQAKKNSAAQF